MGNFKFSLTMLKKDLKKSIAYGFTIFFAIATIFVFFNIINNDFLRDHTLTTSGQSLQDVSIPVSTLVSFVTILFCCFMLGYANSFSLSHKTDEIAIISISGSTYFKITMYLVYQLLMILIVALPLGVLCGQGVSFITNYYMYHYLHINASIYFLSLTTYIDTIATVLAVLFMTVMLDSGYVYRHDLKYMLMQEKENDLLGKKKYHVHDGVYVFIALFSLVMIITTPFSGSAYIFPCLVGSFGLSRVLSQVIPHIIDKYKTKIDIGNKISLIAHSTLSFSLKRSSTLIMLYAMTSLTLIALLISQRHAPREFITSIMAYFVVMILLSVSIMYKYAAEVESRKVMFFNLYKLGYVKKQLVHIIRKEIISYYGLLIVLPMLYFIVLIVLFLIHSQVGIKFVIALMLVEILPAIIMAFLTYFNYKKVVLKRIGETL